MSFIRNTELISQVGFGFHLIVQVCMKTGVYFIQRNKCQPCAVTVKFNSLQDSFSEECRVCTNFHGSPTPSCGYLSIKPIQESYLKERKEGVA